jgi:hypothetical protein
MESPRLASLGSTERIKVLLNHKVGAQAVLDSAASHTFIPLELVEKLGVNVDVSSSSRKVSWIASGVSLEILGSVIIDLTLYTGQGGSVILRSVDAFVLPGKILEFDNLVFVGVTELNSLGIHPLHQLRKSLRRCDDTVSDDEPT